MAPRVLLWIGQTPLAVERCGGAKAFLDRFGAAA
jgi:hypothetical protein